MDEMVTSSALSTFTILETAMMMTMRRRMMRTMTLMTMDNQRDTVWWLLIVLIDRDSRGRSPCGDMITLMIKC